MSLGDEGGVLVISFPKDDILENWQAIEDYARKSAIEIEWDDNRQMLVVKGMSLDHHGIIDDLAAILSVANGEADEFLWDQNWHCKIELHSQSHPFLIVGDREDSIALLRQAKVAAINHLNERIPEWMQAILIQIYPIYVERFGEGAPACQEDFLQMLHINDCIVFDPSCKQYELYVSAAPLIGTHLIHLVEVDGVLCAVELERT